MLSHRIAFAALAFVLSACASAELTGDKQNAKSDPTFADDPRRGEEVNRVCFASSIDSFGETTKRAVVIREGFDYYLVETFGGCFDLDWAQSLSIDARSGCLSRGDDIRPFESAFGPDSSELRALPCKVKAIYEWDRDAAEDGEEGEDTKGDTSEEITTDENAQ